MLTYDDALAAARSGAALLDKKEPGWKDKIDLAKLDLADGCLCVLGQVYGMFEDGEIALGIDQSQAARRGFVAPAALTIQYVPERWRAEYEFLDKAWREVLAS